ncbi:MAG: hypothetical protein JWO00_362 [Candidatus Parcubacteria bacterium]|nr:hypothetical protein [Candidatus Parcubacteria bacterium]
MRYRGESTDAKREKRNAKRGSFVVGGTKGALDDWDQQELEHTVICNQYSIPCGFVKYLQIWPYTRAHWILSGYRFEMMVFLYVSKCSRAMPVPFATQRSASSASWAFTPVRRKTSSGKLRSMDEPPVMVMP